MKRSDQYISINIIVTNPVFTEDLTPEDVRVF